MGSLLSFSLGPAPTVIRSIAGTPGGSDGVGPLLQVAVAHLPVHDDGDVLAVALHPPIVERGDVEGARELVRVEARVALRALRGRGSERNRLGRRSHDRASVEPGDGLHRVRDRVRHDGVAARLVVPQVRDRVDAVDELHVEEAGHDAGRPGHAQRRSLRKALDHFQSRVSRSTRRRGTTHRRRARSAARSPRRSHSGDSRETWGRSRGRRRRRDRLRGGSTRRDRTRRARWAASGRAHARGARAQRPRPRRQRVGDDEHQRHDQHPTNATSSTERSGRATRSSVSHRVDDEHSGRVAQAWIRVVVETLARDQNRKDDVDLPVAGREDRDVGRAARPRWRSRGCRCTRRRRRERSPGSGSSRGRRSRRLRRARAPAAPTRSAARSRARSTDEAPTRAPVTQIWMSMPEVVLTRAGRSCRPPTTP